MSSKMPQTRKRAAMQDAENRISKLMSELLTTQELNIKLMKEQDECSDEYKNLLDQITSLKTTVATQELDMEDLTLQNKKLNDKLVRRSQDITEYEEALNIIRMHENNEALYNQLQKVIQSENEQTTRLLNIEIEGLKNKVVKLQKENIELKNCKKKCKTNNETEKKVVKQIKERSTNILKKKKTNGKSRKKNTQESATQSNQQSTITSDLTNDNIIFTEMEINTLTEIKEEAVYELQNVERTRTYKQCLILCDIFGKSLANYIRQNTTEYKSVFSICKPDSPLKEVVRNLATLTSNMREGDDVIVVASDHEGFKLEIVKYVRDWCKQNKLKFQITCLPYLKSDNAQNHEINQNIFAINTELQKLAAHSNGMSVIDINRYKYRVFRSRYIVSNTFTKFLFDIVVHNSLFEFTHSFDNLIYLTHEYSNPCDVTKNVLATVNSKSSMDFLEQRPTELQAT